MSEGLMSSLPVYTLEEVAKHRSAGDLWCAIDGDVYDLSKFADLHPGGVAPLKDFAGQDATEAFFGLHRADVLSKYKRLKVGRLAGAPAAAEQVAVVPYGEGSGFWRVHSPYYNESHHAFRAAVREFVDREIRPDAAQMDEDGEEVPLELNEKMGSAGILTALVARHFGRYAEEKLGIRLPAGVKASEFDFFHEFILAEEFKRLGTYGLADGLMGGFAIGAPPVLNFGSPELIARMAPGLLSGEKRIALAITEPWAGSDVANIKTHAELSADGKFWIVNGVKKWITGGMYADYFTTLVRCPKGMMTLMVIAREMGVTTKKLKTSYSMAAGTAYVEYKDARVPVENVIGDVGKGFYYAMSNFNTERWGMVVAGNRMSRLMVEECFKWASQRKIFGKRLIDQPVIRLKLAEMAAEVEAVHSFVEDVTYQMSKMNEMEIADKLAGPIALLKYRQTRAATVCSDNACQIFGGRALTRSGMGQFVEKFQRSFKMQAILGGSEEIMADFAIRQAMKKALDGGTTARL
eukprot:gnl/TRDRNA2_/TRDRNA2_80244_c0_seq1.p1 gnl/TRDRNA2_/TRDRNA2_80244_c0~~gnl/TRDRNA2_/TRDRNA2_80244_c0_seq1.p1  ORF type:complete len:521 (+),score=127.37 gnl/TRDRNA2_/TRDRNA2_80244_c0_seq1:87-1649(+)